MNIEKQKQTFNELVAKMEAIMFKKGNDYSKGDFDRLSNFKVAGAIVGSNAPLNCLNLIATKVARLGVLLNKEGSPDNESIEDSILDLANYAVLLYMLKLEEKEQSNGWQEFKITSCDVDLKDRGLEQTFTYCRSTNDINWAEWIKSLQECKPFRTNLVHDEPFEPYVGAPC